MGRLAKGFSLVELLAALTVTLIVSLAVFELFYSNERIFRDQNMVIEMQQTARAAASQLADELRMAGQGVPVYASTFDNADSESVAPCWTPRLLGSVAAPLSHRGGSEAARRLPCARGGGRSRLMLTARELGVALTQVDSVTVRGPFFRTVQYFP